MYMDVKIFNTKKYIYKKVKKQKNDYFIWSHETGYLYNTKTEKLQENTIFF